MIPWRPGPARSWLWRYFFGLFGLAAGLLAGGYEAVAFTYSPVETTVVDSRVVYSRTGKGGYRAAIRFAYTVGGIAYESGRIRRLDYTMTWESWAESDARRFPKGSRVGAWYDPADPSRAVLLRSFSAVTGFLFAIAALGFVMPFLWERHVRTVKERMKR